MNLDYQKKYYDGKFKTRKKYMLKEWQKSYIKRIEESLKPKKGQTLVDIASGAGYVAIEMSKKGLKVIATEISPIAIQHLEEYKKQLKLANLKVIDCVAERIPLPDNSVDYIVANAIFDLTDEQKTVTEWKRILKPKGKIFVSVGHSYSKVNPIYLPVIYLHDRQIKRLRHYTASTLQKAFKLPVEKIYYTGHSEKMRWLIGKTLGINLSSDKNIEKRDSLFKNKEKGATNLIMVFSNAK